MRRPFLCATAFVVAMWPTATRAQQARSSSWSGELYTGLYIDGYDLGDDGDKTGAADGLRVAHAVARYLRLVVDVGYARSHDVTTHFRDYYVYGNEWVISTAGVDATLGTGRTNGVVGFGAGVGWQRFRSEGQVGSPQPSDRLPVDSFSSREVLAWKAMVRHRLARRIALVGGVQDYLFNVFDGPSHNSVAITVGLSLR